MPDKRLVAQRADQLRALHYGDRPLVLPNVWDAASAKVAAAAGFPALATGSASVAEVLGHADHEAAPPSEMFAAAARITGAVEVPVTVDVEAGYGLPPSSLGARLTEAGAAGCNLEDSDHLLGGLMPAEKQAERLAWLRAATRAAGVDLVINARVDVFVQEWGSPSERVAETVRRALIYFEAGADCVYPILAPDAETIRELVASVKGPVNVLHRPGSPSFEELARWGVARVTFGPGLHRATMRAFGDMVARLAGGADPYDS
ncbi:MAG: isocitrate lyase/phosphoenolpyruvate mutase family protein [Micromonosporaceae bacterium]|nr:isocitrate lyase/phosphoenolpyruvate mutase family protein [Micromonosporaceae bacterium]